MITIALYIHLVFVEKNKCVDFCYKDENYKFEHNNLCYESCPVGTHNSSNNEYICEKDLICDNFYNFNYTSCLDDIPDGFYLNNSELKSIDKCYIKCNTCSLESNKCNLCITYNNKNNYYQKYNDTSNNNFFVNCYNKEFEGYFLDKSINMYMPCFPTCKYCIELGNEIVNKCIEYYFNIPNSLENCQDNKSLYYNEEANKCFSSLDDCFSNNYNYYFNKICYNNGCPSGTISLIDITNITIKNVS